MRIIARCAHGLEWLCAAELSATVAGGGDIALDRRELVFSLASLEPSLLNLRTVDDAFAEAGRFDGIGTTKAALPSIAQEVSRLPWAALAERIQIIRPVSRAPLIDVVASLEGRRSYNRFAVEQAAGEAVSRVLGGTYLRRTADGRAPGEPELAVRLFLRGDRLIAALRIGAVPAHRRAYKLDAGPGTLHPPAAAALARLADPRPGTRVLDPFCGDGTIAIETVLAYPATQVAASDADPERVASTARNAARARAVMHITCADALSAGVRADVIVTNPPWNLGVDASGALAGSLDPFWPHAAGLLAPAGRLVVLAGAELDVPNTLRRMGFGVGLVIGVRLAGRICHVVLAAPPGQALPEIPDEAMRWRTRAIETGVLAPWPGVEGAG